jgi:hypothetical protein
MNERYKRLSHALRAGLVDGKLRSKLTFSEREACRLTHEFLQRIDRLIGDGDSDLLAAVLRFELEHRREKSK